MEKRIVTQLLPITHQKLKLIAVEKGITLMKLINDILENWLKSATSGKKQHEEIH